MTDKERRKQDATYQNAIDALIPQAEKMADTQVAKEDVPRDERSALWTRIFHGTMNRLAREAGLRKMAFEV